MTIKPIRSEADYDAALVEIDRPSGGAEAAGLDEFLFGCVDCATYGVAVGDLNGDGFPEIVTANSGAPNGVFGNLAARN